MDYQKHACGDFTLFEIVGSDFDQVGNRIASVIDQNPNHVRLLSLGGKLLIVVMSKDFYALVASVEQHLKR